jgi:hypothetical protein
MQTAYEKRRRDFFVEIDRRYAVFAKLAHQTLDEQEEVDRQMNGRFDGG